jgi:hypothetical protein
MAQTRRAFLQTAAMAIGAVGGAGDGVNGDTSRFSVEGRTRDLSTDSSPIQVPKMRFGPAEISRLIVGVRGPRAEPAVTNRPRSESLNRGKPGRAGRRPALRRVAPVRPASQHPPVADSLFEVTTA